MKRTIGLILTFLILTIALIAFLSFPKADVDRTVFVQNVPFAELLGHVVKKGDRIELRKTFPLYEDDGRDGIWSQRLLGESPMEKINFPLKQSAKEEHGIILYCGEWIIVWFDESKSERISKGRIEWKIVPVDCIEFTRRRDWTSANGSVENLSVDQLRFIGDQSLIEFQNQIEAAAEQRRLRVKRAPEL